MGSLSYELGCSVAVLPPQAVVVSITADMRIALRILFFIFWFSFVFI